MSTEYVLTQTSHSAEATLPQVRDLSQCLMKNYWPLNPAPASGMEYYYLG